MCCVLHTDRCCNYIYCHSVPVHTLLTPPHTHTAGTVVDPLTDPLKLTKTFRMHNSGSTSITLRIIGLEGGSCEGRGFVISNCNKDITIKPNRSKKIEIT